MTLRYRDSNLGPSRLTLVLHVLTYFAGSVTYLRSSVDVQHQRLVLRDDKPGLLPASSPAFLHVMEKTTNHAVLRCQGGLFLWQREKETKTHQLHAKLFRGQVTVIKVTEMLPSVKRSGTAVDTAISQRWYPRSPPGLNASYWCCLAAHQAWARLPPAWRSSRCTRGWSGCCRTTSGHETPNISRRPPAVRTEKHRDLLVKVRTAPTVRTGDVLKP